MSAVYPCDFGMPLGFHTFVWSAGRIICSACGAHDYPCRTIREIEEES